MFPRKQVSRSRRFVPCVAGLLLLLVGASSATAQPVEREQVFQLQPGWNSIYLEVEPEDNSMGSVFAGLPILSVWHWNRAESTAEFIEDPADGLIPSAEWQGYFPRPRPEAFLTNLFGVMVNEAYLVEVGGDQPVTLTVKGRPSLFPRQRWLVDGFTLTGMFVDPASPATFGVYFGPSDAHAGQPTYRLDPSGVWQPILSLETTPIQAGEAYWVYTQGGSDYQGPLELDFEGRTAMDYGAGLTSQPWSFDNKLAFDVDVRLDFLSAPFPVPLTYEVFDEESGVFSNEPMPKPFVLETRAGRPGPWKRRFSASHFLSTASSNWSPFATAPASCATS